MRLRSSLTDIRSCAAATLGGATYGLPINMDASFFLLVEKLYRCVLQLSGGSRVPPMVVQKCAPQVRGHGAGGCQGAPALVHFAPCSSAAITICIAAHEGCGSRSPAPAPIWDQPLVLASITLPINRLQSSVLFPALSCLSQTLTPAWSDCPTALQVLERNSQPSLASFIVFCSSCVRARDCCSACSAATSSSPFTTVCEPASQPSAEAQDAATTLASSPLSLSLCALLGL